jgi:predicted RNA-binding Zn-ribbon protein involved in translation (DUF1610 family)
VNREGSDRFRCPGCGKAVAWRIHGPTWRPTYRTAPCEEGPPNLLLSLGWPVSN